MATQLGKNSLDRYRDSLSHVRPLDPNREHELAKAWLAGDRKAGELLIESSLPFVIHIAREYRRWGVPLEDLIQQGNLGLLKAASKFDPAKECRLITYAAYWIRAEIRDYVVRTYRIVRLGTTRTERRAMRVFRRSSVDSATQLAELSGMPESRAEKLWPLLMQGDVSLDVQYEDRTTAVERLRDERGQSPAEDVERELTIDGLRSVLDTALARLSEREQRIVRARMMSEEPITLEELGREMGVSKERVRQLEVRARTKLRESLATFESAA